MGRGGGGGGGRSGGSRGASTRSAGSRSSGGSRASFSSGRSRGHGSSSGSRGSRGASGGSRGSSFGGPGPRGPMRQAGMWNLGYRPSVFGRRRAGYGYGGYGAPYGSGGCGCLSGLFTLIVLAAVLVFAVPVACSSRLTGCSSRPTSGSDSNNASQTSSRKRQKLAAAECVESSQWIDDQAGWLDDRDKVVDAMRSFYDLTGVQPYLVIADELNGSKTYSESDVESYLRNLYDELYEDDGHLILLFLEPYENEYDPYMIVGQKAQSVVDTAGEDLIYEAIDRWYTDSSLTDDAYFARIFVASANALMYGTSFSEFG